MSIILNFEDCINTYTKTIEEIMQKVSKDIENANFNIDVMYSSEKYMDLKEELIDKLALLNGYSQTNYFKEQYRKFEILNKRNVTTSIILKHEKDVINVLFKVDVENIVINSNNIFEELNKTLFFYWTQYIKWHYIILSEVNPDFLNQNNDFYTMIYNKYCK